MEDGDNRSMADKSFPLVHRHRRLCSRLREKKRYHAAFDAGQAHTVFELIEQELRD